MAIDQELRELVLSKSDTSHILNAARKRGFRPLREEGNEGSGWRAYDL